MVIKNKKILSAQTIVFARLMPTYRIYKEALGLKKLGKYKTILLGERCNREMFSEIVDAIIDFKSFWTASSFKNNKTIRFFYKLLYSNFLSANIKPDIPLKQTGQQPLTKKTEVFLRWNKLIKIVKNLKKKAALFHVVTEPNIVPALIMKNVNKPVIYDIYDFSGIRYGVDQLSPLERAQEKFCLENADGICMKFPEWILDYYRKLDYRINCPVLNFIDYCVPEFFSYQPNSLARKNIHLVYTGIISPSSCSPLDHGNNQYLEIIKKIIAQKIYFHLYIQPWQLGDKNLYSDYYQLNDQNKYFILHETKFQPELQKEICRYHFGCNLNDFSQTRHTRLFAETSFGNKTATYLEAGLPIIINEDLKLNTEFVEKYGIGFRINLKDLPNLSQKIKTVDYQGLKDNVRRARQGPLNLYQNTYKLTDFYDKIISKNKSLK